jgi:hypothetical protein
MKDIAKPKIFVSHRVVLGRAAPTAAADATAGFG